MSTCPAIRLAQRFAATLLLLVGPLGLAAIGQVSDTTWVVNGRAVLKLTGAPVSGKQTARGPGVIRFLPGGFFEIEDAAGVVVGGSWSEGSGEVSVLVSQADIVEFLEENLGASVSQLQGLVVDDLQSSAKLVQKKSGVGVLTYKLGFVLAFSVDGEPVTLRYRLKVTGQYDLSGASAGGNTWMLDGKQVFKAPGHKLVETAGLRLVLGPDGGLDTDRFALRDGVGTTLFTGYFTRVGRKIAMLPDASSVEAYVEAWIAPTVDMLFPGGTVTLETVVSRFRGTLKKNGTLRLRGKTVFFSDLERGPQESGSFKSSYRVGASS